MKNLAIALILSLLISGVIIYFCDEIEKENQSLLEQAYFDGQKDALNGDVRIQFRSDSCWHWIKNPWDSNSLEVVFKPESMPGRK